MIISINISSYTDKKKRGRHGRDRMVVGVATTLYIRNQNISAGCELTALVVIGTDCTWSISA